MNDSHPTDSDENARINDATPSAADSSLAESQPRPPADDRTEPESMPESAASAPVEEPDPEPVGESAESLTAISDVPDQEELEAREPESAAVEMPQLEEPSPVPAEEAPLQAEGEVAESAPTETEAKPKPRKPRKSKTAASGADGPGEAPASTDPNAAPAPASAEAPADSGKKWYVVKVQSGREDSIKSAIERKVKIEGLEPFFGQIAIPVEEIIVKRQKKTTDKKTGEKVTREEKVVKHTKKYPGYLFAEVEFNDRILFLFRDTSGVGDFVGAGLKREPTPMTDREVTQMLTGVVDKDAKKGSKGPMKVKLDIEKGDKVKIRDGAFANMEGEVKSISEAKEDAETPKVTVVVTIFGRPVEVELDYWHVDKV
jgi:transcriptional antiterminator NusG